MKKNDGMRRGPGRGTAMQDIPLVGDPKARLGELASRLRCEGEATLAPSRGDRRRLARALRGARRMTSCGAGAGAALRRLGEEARMIEDCAARACREGGVRLPACGGVPRIALVARTLLGAGERRLTEEGLLDGLRAFDAARPLTQRELWSVPEALRMAIVESCGDVAVSIVRSARAAEAAARWVRGQGGGLRGRSADFFERALMLCGEEGLAKARAKLERWLRSAGDSPERVIGRVHDARAFDLMRLDNLMSARRLLDALDWQDCFDALSAVEAELRRDPSGVYPLMDDESRQAVREQVTRIARAARLAEDAVARHATLAAREASAGRRAGGEASPPGQSREDSASLRGGVCWWLWDDEGRRALAARMGRRELRLPRMAPDPSGARCMLGVAALAAVLLALLARWMDGALWLACAPLAWTSAGALTAAVFPRLLRPARLLRLAVDTVPDALRTLVVTPVLISDVARAASMCDQLEALGCLEADGNIEYLLLGDFADADAPDMPGDAEILRYIGGRIAGMNARAGRARYHFLHRPRTLLKADGRYMGRDRKRGALMALNGLLLGEEGAQAAFLWLITES